MGSREPILSVILQLPPSLTLLLDVVASTKRSIISLDFIFFFITKDFGSSLFQTLSCEGARPATITRRDRRAERCGSPSDNTTTNEAANQVPRIC
ncbi:hypothetical protein T265_12342 [Opisthorchis viverrini]|uniref:Uncharacterized protein n=1 Tax=Opisthorchis viverrini TaxID=6198 RepID=A0A074YU15_OPIVI|nr:hypothetical protein T265_12342 [Opisthorchis viverrini]KER18203.1 hypothetical protein T265_12342 [Opisthorchis viverrini]